MISGDSAMMVFTTVAGVAPAKMSIYIRTVLIGITFLWAGWCVYGEIQFFKHHEIDAVESIRKLTRILLIVSLMVVFIFI